MRVSIATPHLPYDVSPINFYPFGVLPLIGKESRDYVCNKLIRILQQWDFRQSPELILMIAQFLELLREACPAELYASRRGALVNALLFDHYLYEAFR